MLYIIIYISIVFLFFSSQRKKHVNSQSELIIILSCLALIVGFGDMLGGYDRYAYCDLFDRCADTVRAGQSPYSVGSPIMGYSNEMSYVYWNVWISHVTENRYIYILITSLFMYVMFYLSFKEYVNNYPFALLLFMSLFFFFTFTYLRQVLATCFCWFSYRYVMKRQFWKFALCAIIAYKFHNSAIVFFPFYFIPRKKFPPKTVIAVMVVLLLIGITGIPSSLYGMYGDATGTDARTEQYMRYGSSFRLEYVLEVVVFLFFIFKYYDRIPTDVKSITLLNASLCFCAFILFFVTSSTAGRQSWYYMMGIIGTLTYLVTHSKSSQYVNTMMLVMALLFLRFVIYWGILVSPYKSFLTDGHRANDPIFLQYEYDEKYDKDKFYRKAIDFQW